ESCIYAVKPCRGRPAHADESVRETDRPIPAMRLAYGALIISVVLPTRIPMHVRPSLPKCHHLRQRRGECDATSDHFDARGDPDWSRGDDREPAVLRRSDAGNRRHHARLPTPGSGRGIAHPRTATGLIGARAQLQLYASRVRIMSRVNFTRGQPVEYFILMEPHPDGPIVGRYAGHAIAEAVVDYFGRRFTYAGIAPRLRSGRYDVESLRPGEWIVEPGLVYYATPAGPENC